MEEVTQSIVIRNGQFPDIAGRKFSMEIEEFEYHLLDEFRTALENIEDLNCPMNDTFLIRFLRARKYKLEAAVKTVVHYFDLRRQNLDYTHIPYMNHGKVYDSKIAMILKDRDEKGRHIVCIRISQWDTSMFTFDELATALFVLIEEITSTPETQRNGIIFILDATDVTVSHAKEVAKECSMRQLKKIITFFQGAIPARIKGVFGINIPFIFTTVYALVKYLLKPKLRSRIHLSSAGPECLHSHLSPKILPEFLGGDLSFEEADDTSFSTMAMKNETYYRSLEKYGYSC